MKLLLAITVAAFVAMFIMQMRRERWIWKGELLCSVSYFRKCFYVYCFQVEVWGRSVTLEEDWKNFQTFRDRWTKDLHYGWATSWDLYRAPVSFKKKWNRKSRVLPRQATTRKKGYICLYLRLNINVQNKKKTILIFKTGQNETFSLAHGSSFHLGPFRIHIRIYEIKLMLKVLITFAA